MAFAKPNVGDIVEVEWWDHFRYKGELPPLMTVRSIGMFEEETEEGIAIVQNEVLTGAEGSERVMDGQFIMLPAIISIRVIRKAKK